MTTPANEANSLRRVYTEKEALAGICFPVRPGKIFGLLGPNGAAIIGDGSQLR
jgi:ABC-type multidrug transport system ATPase subunit